MGEQTNNQHELLVIPNLFVQDCLNWVIPVKGILDPKPLKSFQIYEMQYVYYTEVCETKYIGKFPEVYALRCHSW